MEERSGSIVSKAKLDAAEEDGAVRNRTAAGILAMLDGMQLATGTPIGVVARLMQAWYTGGRAERQAERFRQAWDNLDRRLSSLEKQARLNWSVLESEPFVEFVDVALTRALAEQDDAKRARYSAIAGSYAVDEINRADGPRMLLILDSLTEREVVAMGRMVAVTRAVFAEVALATDGPPRDWDMEAVKNAVARFDLERPDAVDAPRFFLSELDRAAPADLVADLETLRRLGLLHAHPGKGFDTRLSLSWAGIGFAEWLGLDPGKPSAEVGTEWQLMWQGETTRRTFDALRERLRVSAEEVRKWQSSLSEP